MKRIFTFAGIMAAALAMSAAPLTPEQALKRAQASSAMRKSAISAGAMTLSFSMQTPAGSPAIYVFDRPESKGYLIVSADDAAIPVLGYADSGSFDSEEMPPQLEWWLSEYAAQISSSSANDISSKKITRSGKAAVSPLVKTTWNQGTPYNNLCPSVGNSKCPTGCVATAMAQVMKYHNYPPVGMGRVTATIPTGGSGDGYINLAQKPFDWDNMLDAYSGYDYTNQQATAVATLMQAAGYASKMNYTLTGSGALSLNAAMSLSKNFKYNPYIQYLQRSYFSASEWDEIIYNELAAGRPVMYGGQSTSVGHEFVCDGYDGNGYYHFNWGWGGMSDGYFLLDALNPDSVGTGGGEGGGYNSGQDIIIGVQPASEELNPYLTQFGNLTGSVSGSKLNLLVDNGSGHWLNAGISSIKINIGVEISPVGSTSSTTRYISVLPGLSIGALTVNGYQVSYDGIKGNCSVNLPSDLPNGTYKVTVCSQDANKTNAPWTPVCTTSGAHNFVYVTKSGNSWSVQSFDEAELSIISATPTTQVYYQNACRFKLSVSNTSNIEMTGGFYPVLFDGTKEAMLGEGITLSLKPNEKTETEFLTVFELLEGATVPTTQKEYTLKFAKNASGTEYYDWSAPLTVYVVLGSMSFSVNDYSVTGAATRQENINGTDRTAFVVGNPSEIPFSATITNTGAFFGSQVYTLIFNGNLSGYSLTSGAMGPTPVLNRGQSATVKGSVDFTEAEANESYAAVMFYMGKEGLEQARSCPIIYFVVDPSASAIDEIANDNNDTDGEIFNLQGIPVGKDLNSLPAGTYIRNGKKVMVRR